MARHIRRWRLWLQRLEERLPPTVFTVTNANDSGAGSLRQSILDANAVSGADEIVFDAAFAQPQTIPLTSGEITITSPLVVTGPGAEKLTISGNQLQRILKIDQAASTITLTGLTFKDGRTFDPHNPVSGSGAAVYSNAAVTLQSCVFTENSMAFAGVEAGVGVRGSAVCVESKSSAQNGNLTISDCQFLDNTGYYGTVAVVVTAPSPVNRSLTLQRSLFRDNVAYSGGAGLFIGGGVSGTIADSAFVGNQANGGVGGAITADNLSSTIGNLIVRNSTFSGNVAARGGAVYFGGSGTGHVLTLQNNTIYRNKSTEQGGGLWSRSGAAKISSTVVVDNTSPTGPDIFSLSLVGIDYCAISQSGGFKMTDLGGNLPFGTDVKLGRLSDYGGTILTLLPATNSPLIDAGANPAALAYDQRGPGYPRQVGPGTDIGAAESDGSTPVVYLTSLADVIASGATTYAITVTFYTKTGIDTATLGTGDLRVTGPNGFDSEFALQGFTGEPTAVSATYLLSPPGGFWDGPDDGDYSVALISGEVTDVFGTPVTSGELGKIRVLVPRQLVVTTDADDGTGSLRAAIAEAERIAPSADTITFDPVFFASTRTITLIAGELQGTDSITIQGPGADLLTIGGANAHTVFDFVNIIDPLGTPCDLTLMDMTVTGGNAGTAYVGGGVFFYGRSLVIADAVFTGNQAGHGGAVDAYCSTSFEARDSRFSANKAYTGGFADGGALFINAKVSAIRRCEFVGNSATFTGGAVQLVNGGTIDACTFRDNTAELGGAIYLYGDSFTEKWTVVNSTISGNHATNAGGGIGILFSNVTVRNTTITANVADTKGGGISRVNNGIGSIIFESSIISGNSAPAGPDVSSTSSVSAASSALGSADGYSLTDLGGNLPIGIDLKLGSLADNGGPTQTISIPADSPCINAGSNPAGVPTDQRGAGYYRVIGESGDIGAFEYQNLPAVISSVQINDGSPQRSMVTSLIVTFDRPVTVNANSFQLVRQSDNAPVSLSASVLGSSVTLTFNSGLVEYGSLVDGRYTLTAFASLINGSVFDGNGDMVSGDDYVLVGTPSNGLFRLFGDADGNGTVNSADVATLRTFFGLGTSLFDFNNDGQTNSNDFIEFRRRFGLMI